MNRIYYLIAIIALSVCPTATYAAFPAQTQALVTEQVTVKSQPVAYDYTYSTATMKPARTPAPPATPEIGLILGILALVFGILAIATWSSIAAVIFGAAAIIVGVIGLGHTWRGLSLAGLILGIIGVVVGLVSIAS